MRTGATSVARRATPRGYTLAESLIASVVLAAAVIGISGTLSASYQQSSVRGNTTTALTLAQQLMEEISSRPIDPPSGSTDAPGWSNGQTDRALYDTVGDYNGYTDVSSSIKIWDGSTIDASDGGAYTRTVSVTANAKPASLGGTAPASDFFLVTVTVQMPHDATISIAQLRSRVSIYR